MAGKETIVVKKVDRMDEYLNAYKGEITSSVICSVVKDVFEFDLETKPVLSKEWLEAENPPSSKNIAITAINASIVQYGKAISGTQIRLMINDIFGINLDAISALEESRISLFSKEQWVVQHERDLFLVHTGIGDIDVKILPTNYFTQQTGLTALPEELQQALAPLGFYYDENVGSFYYANPTGEAIQDSFKGQTIGTILKVIHQYYPNI